VIRATSKRDAPESGLKIIAISRSGLTSPTGLENDPSNIATLNEVAELALGWKIHPDAAEADENCAPLYEKDKSAVIRLEPGAAQTSICTSPFASTL
jgi:hypothetical protein